MKRKIIISFLLILILFLGLSVFVLTEKALSQDEPLGLESQETAETGIRALEVQYPEIYELKPETIDFPIAAYFKYIFNFAIATMGMVAFAALIWFGIKFFTSGGNPEKIRQAKKQIKSTALGILILLFSYLIIVTINPQLTVFDLPGITITEKTIPDIPISTPGGDMFSRIAKFAQAVKQTAESIENTVKEIKSLTDKCDCSQAKSACICQGDGGGMGGGGMGGTSEGGNGDYSLDYYGECSALYCYSSTYTQPCPDYLEIRGNLQKFVALRDVMLYYRNRALAEVDDIEKELKEVTDKKIKWHEDKIASEEEVLEQLDEGTQKNLTQLLINFLGNDLDKLKKEKAHKESIRDKLIELAEEIEKINDPAEKLKELPEQCLSDVGDKCTGSCSGGCHDTTGCFPDSCSGGNPCPTSDIEKQVNEIKSIARNIKRIADEIIVIVDTATGAPKKEPTCELSKGVCVESGQSCPSGHYLESKLPCPEENEQCCLPEALCKCTSPEGSGCVLLTDYGITCKDGCYTDPEIAEKLVVFKNCLDRNNITGWRVTEACPPVVQHISRCHHVDGRCVDVNSVSLCHNRAIARQCIGEAGFSGYLDECDTAGPHFHINY